MTAKPVFTEDQIITQLQTQWGTPYEGTYRKWAGSDVYYSVRLLAPAPTGGGQEVNGFDPNIMTPHKAAMATIAFELWDDLIAINLNSSTDASSSITFAYSGTTANSGTYTIPSFPGSGPHYTLTTERVWINSTDNRFDSDGDIAYETFGFSTYVHEIGHSLGLSHPGTYNATVNATVTFANDAEYAQDDLQRTVMSYFGGYKPGAGWQPEKQPDFTNWLYPSTPMVDDIAAIQAVYGADLSTRSGATVYGYNSTAGRAVYDFNTNTQPIFTIWDGGGNDTLDCSGFSGIQTIDLRPGEYSSILGMTNNIAMALAVTSNGVVVNYIENANGGSAADYIIGNAAGNILKGNGGNDTLEGNWGNDTIYGDGGTDTAVFYGFRSSYHVNANSDGSVTVAAFGPGATDGTDTLYNVENFKFADRAAAYSLNELLPPGDTAAPTILSTFPSDNATGVATVADVVLTFNENVRAGPGVIEIHKSDGTLVRSIVATDSSQVTFSGSTVTINPSSNLLANTGYYVLVASNAVRDLADNFFTGIASSSTLNFTTSAAPDTLAPALSGTSPSDNAGSVAVNANIGLTFNENVLAGSGNLDIHNSNGTIFKSIAITDTSQVTFSGTTVTINPNIDLAAGSDYYVTAAAGAIRDLSGNSFSGISSSTTLNFTTASAPVVPAPNTTSAFLSIADNTVTEGNNGTKIFSFGVTLTGAGAGTQTVSVQYATEDIAGAGSPATAGQDYIAASGVLVIPAGQTTGHIDILVVGDLQVEPDEVFRLVLTQPSTGVTLLNSSGQAASSVLATGFIDNDDQAPNRGPTGTYDLAITAPNTPITIDVLANDSDIDGDSLHIASGGGLDPVANSSGGSVSLSNNKILYTPANNFAGVFSYTYILDDGHGGLRNVFSQVIVAGDGSPGITNPGTVDSDLITGTGGNDILSGSAADDIIAGGPGADRIDGGPGFDYLDLRQAAHAANVQFRDAWIFDDGDGSQDILTNIEGVFGSRFDDRIDGSSANIQYITTGYRFYGGDGNDRLQSDAGDDILDGGDGNDTLIFGAGRDIVFGGAGNDQIYGFNNQSDAVGDTLRGGTGDDSISSTDGVSADLVFGEEGNDSIQFGNGDIVSGGPGADSFFFAGFNSITPYHATITDLAAGDTIKWQFRDPVIINNTAHYFIGPITGGNGTGTALDHVEFASANGQTTLYFGFDTTPGADFVLSLNGTFGINQFQVDDSNFTLAMHVSARHAFPHDFDANLRSDILWQNDNGATSIWDNGAIGGAHIIAAAGVVPTSWHIAGKDDFDGNGQGDILWRNDNGAASIWDNGAIGNAHIISAAGVVPNSWHISGTGDFDGNGHDDILWRNDNGAASIWDDGQIANAHIISAAGVVPNSWHISGTGDFDGNGHDDILWRNDNGAASIWDNGAIGGAHIIGAAGVVPNSWHISGTGDFDGNGHDDILWRNDNGAVSIWDDGQIGGAHIVSAAGVVPNSWHISDTGDFDGNGHSDILWRNDNGAASIWDDGAIGGAHIIANAGVIPDGWHIV